MDLQDLRPATLGWLDDPKGDRFVDHDSFARLDVLINLAYKDAVLAMDACTGAWNVKDAPETITVTSSVRRYLLTSSDVRRPLSARRVEASGSHTNLIEAPWGGRDDYARRPLRGLRGPPPERIAWFRDATTGAFGMVFYDEDPSAQTVEVHYQPLVLDLTAPDHIPYQVPQQWQHILPIGAGFFGKMQARRDNKDLAALWFSMRGDMVADLNGITRGRSWRPI